MAKYRKKPVVIEAFKWTGGPDQTEDPEWICEALRQNPNSMGSAVVYRDPLYLGIKTLEGVMRGEP